METLISGSKILGKQLALDREYGCKSYDFKKPDKFSNEQIRTIQIIHETFARLATTTFSAGLRSIVDVQVRLVDQVTYSDFLALLPSSTLMGIFGMDPLRGNALLQLDAPLTFGTLDRLFGGEGLSGGLERDITDIECSVIEELLLRLIRVLAEAWQPVLTLAPKLAQIETNPQFAQIVPPQEMVCLVEFEVSLAGVSSKMRLCLPWLTIDPIMYRLSAQYMYSIVRRSGSPLDMNRIRNLKLAAELVALGQELSLTEIQSLKRGSMIRLSGFDDGLCQLRAGSNNLLNLKPGARQGGSQFFGIEAEDDPTAQAFLDSGGATGIEAGVGELRSGLNALSEQVGRISAELENGLRSLRESQETMADQMVYGGNPTRTEAPATLPAAAPDHEPFAALESMSPALIGQFLSYEMPQLDALVLMHLGETQAAAVLEGLPASIQPDVLRRMVHMDRVAPQVVAEVDRVLVKKLTAIGNDAPAPVNDTVKQVAGLLNMVPAATEKFIIESLEQSDPALCEQIKARMFVFDDIIMLRPADIRAVLEQVQQKDLVLALKLATQAARDAVLGQLETKLKAAVLEGMETIGRIRLSDADAAGMRIVSVIRRMEEEGRIVIGRSE